MINEFRSFKKHCLVVYLILVLKLFSHYLSFLGYSTIYNLNIFNEPINMFQTAIINKAFLSDDVIKMFLIIFEFGSHNWNQHHEIHLNAQIKLKSCANSLRYGHLSKGSFPIKLLQFDPC